MCDMSPYYPSQASLLVATQGSSYPGEYTPTGSAPGDYHSITGQPLYHPATSHADLVGVGIDQKPSVAGSFANSSSVLHGASAAHYHLQPAYAHSAAAAAAVYPRYSPFDRLDGGSAAQMYAMGNGGGGGGNAAVVAAAAANGSIIGPGSSASINHTNNNLHHHLSNSHINGQLSQHHHHHHLHHAHSLHLSQPHSTATGSVTVSVATANGSNPVHQSPAHTSTSGHPGNGNSNNASASTVNNSTHVSSGNGAGGSGHSTVNSNSNQLHGSPPTPVGNLSLTSGSSGRSSPMHASLQLHSINLQNSANSSQLHSLDSSSYFSQLNTSAPGTAASVGSVGSNGNSHPIGSDGSPAHSNSSGSIHTPPHAALQLPKSEPMLVGASAGNVSIGNHVSSLSNMNGLGHHPHHHQLAQLHPLSAANAGAQNSSHHLLGTGPLIHQISHANGSSLGHHPAYLNCSPTPPISQELGYAMPPGMGSPPLTNSSNNNGKPELSEFEIAGSILKVIETFFEHFLILSFLTILQSQVQAL